MPSRFPRHDVTWWRTTVSDFRKSGAGPTAFAAQVHVHPDTLRWWCQKFDGRPVAKSVPTPVGLVRVDVVPTVAGDNGPSAPTAVEVCVGQVTVCFAAGTDCEYLVRLLHGIAQQVARC